MNKFFIFLSRQIFLFASIQVPRQTFASPQEVLKCFSIWIFSFIKIIFKISREQQFFFQTRVSNNLAAP